MARMRLRSRRSQPLGADWVQPRGTGRRTSIGTLDSGVLGAVDPAGLVTVEGVSWSLDWWIGAEDRWHLPCREAAVRQALVGGSPVVETRVRVPSGDAVHRVYGARAADGGEGIVVEVENQSKIPFAVALALRPHVQDQPGRIEHVALEGATVRVDGSAAVVLPRSPGRAVLCDGAQGDAAHVVLAGAAGPPTPAPVRCADALANAALLFPLAHTATLRVVLPTDRTGRAEPSALPSAAQVSAGWASHAASGTRIELPDRRLRDGLVASVRHLLLGGSGPEAAAALDLMGFAEEAERLLREELADLTRHDAPLDALHALSRHWELTHDADFARAVVDAVAALVPRVCRGPETPAVRGTAALRGARALLQAAGETRAAADVEAAELRNPVADPPEDFARRLASVSSTWTWEEDGAGHDVRVNAAMVAHVRELVLAERADALVLAPTVPDAWLGQGWELHDAPTARGCVSYAVRWHGDRPALLWDLRGWDQDAPVTLVAPGLDPQWSTTEARGEALLSAVAIPDRGTRRGLTIPVAIEAPPRRST